MTRKLTKNDHKQLFVYLKEEADFNLFMVGNVGMWTMYR